MVLKLPTWQASGAPDGACEDSLEALPEVAPEPCKGVFNAQEDEDWNAEIEPLSQHSYYAAAAFVTVAILQGSNNLDRAAANLPEQAAISPALAAQYVQEGSAMYERIVAKKGKQPGKSY